MNAICANRAEKALRSFNRWLKDSANRLLKDEITVATARIELRKRWQKEWCLYADCFSNDPGPIVDDLRLGVVSGGSRLIVAPTALYILRVLIAGRDNGFDGISADGSIKLGEILDYLLSTYLPEEFSDFEVNLRKTAGKMPAVAIGKLLQSKNGADLTLFKSVLEYSARENGPEDFSLSLIWKGCKEFSRSKNLQELWPKEFKKNVDEKFLKKLPPRVQQVVLADSPSFYLNQSLLEKLRANPLEFKNSPQARKKDISIKRFTRQPWNTFRKITEGNADETLVANIWYPEVLNRIKNKTAKVWLEPWIFSPSKRDQKLFSSDIQEKLVPQLACIVGFLSINNSLGQLKWLIRCSQAYKGFKISQVPTTSLLSLIGKIPKGELDSELLGQLSQCDRSYWQQLAPKLSRDILKKWVGPTDARLINWILDKDTGPASDYLNGFHGFVADLFNDSKIIVDRSSSEFLETLDFQKITYDKQVAQVFGVVLQGADAKVGRWLRSVYAEHIEDSGVRIAISLKLASASAECRKAFCAGLKGTAQYVRFLVESKILLATEKSIALLAPQANGKTRARTILQYLRTKEGYDRFGKLPIESLYGVLKTRQDIFAEELARFFPDRIGQELWSRNKFTMLQAACGSARASDWIATHIPIGELREIIPDVRKELSEKPTLAAAIEIGLLSGVRDLPLLTKLAFKRWKGDPRKSQGRTFDDDYHTFKLPKKAGGNRVITAPSDELKRLQRRLLDNLLIQSESHPSVHGYIRGRSCATNAKSHEKREIVAKLDIKSFFPSTPYHLIVKSLRKMAGAELSQGALFLLADICSYDGGLPIGAPCSPALGNIILTRFDEVVGDRAKKMGVTYTRYADDLVFSGDRSAIWMLGFAKGLLKKIGYVTDSKKELIMRKGMRQTVTGLVVNSTANLPRRQRKKLRAALHSMSVGKEPKWHGKPANKNKIIGILGFLNSVNHESAEKLKNKYLQIEKEGE